MKINNQERIFILHGDDGFRTSACNIEDLSECRNEFDDKDSIQYKHIWNGVTKRASKKLINNMAKSAGLNWKLG